MQRRQLEVRVWRDSTKGKFIEFRKFKQIIQFLHFYQDGRHAFGKLQGFLMYLGATCFRPGHVRKAQLNWLRFHDMADPKLAVLDTKHVPKKAKVNGVEKAVMVFYDDWDENEVSLFVRDYFIEYVRRRKYTFVNNLLFPGQAGHPISTQTWDCLLAKLRKAMYAYDPIKYAWVNEIIGTRFNGIDKKTGQPRTARRFRLSLYSLRHSNITWDALNLLNRGIPGVELHAAKRAGHSPERQYQIFSYIQKVLKRRANGEPELQEIPNLQENILEIEPEEDHVGKIVQRIANHPDFEKLVEKLAREPCVEAARL